MTNLNYSYNQEVRYIHKNGSVVWLHCLGLVIRGENGKPLRMLGTAREITEQKQAFWKLKESEEKFRQIFEQSPLAIQLYNEKGDLLEVNLQTLELFGIADKEQIAKFNLWSSQDLTPEKTRQLKANKPIQIASIFDFELAKQHNIIQSKHTGIKQLDMFVAPILINEDVRGYLGSDCGNHRTKNANKELQSQRDLLQIIINTVPSRIFWKDLNSVYIGCNTLLQRMPARIVLMK